MIIFVVLGVVLLVISFGVVWLWIGLVVVVVLLLYFLGLGV